MIESALQQGMGKPERVLEGMNTLLAPILHLTGTHRSDNIGTESETEVLHGISIALQRA